MSGRISFVFLALTLVLTSVLEAEGRGHCIPPTVFGAARHPLTHKIVQIGKGVLFKCLEGYSLIRGNPIKKCVSAGVLRPTELPVCIKDKDCGMLYETRLGIASPGGLFEHAKNLKECKERCNAEHACRGLDFNYVNGHCHIHEGENYVNHARKARDKTTNQYRKVIYRSCGKHKHEERKEEVKKGCGINYQRKSQTVSPGGTHQKDETLRKCKDSCSVRHACRGFDFNERHGHCYHHYNANFISKSRQSQDPTTSQYRKSESGSCKRQEKTVSNHCTVRYEEKSHTLSTGGNYKSGKKTLKDCKSACSAHYYCKGFDFNGRRGHCYFHEHDDFTSRARRSQDPTTSQYRKSKSC